MNLARVKKKHAFFAKNQRNIWPSYICTALLLVPNLPFPGSNFGLKLFQQEGKPLKGQQNYRKGKRTK